MVRVSKHFNHGTKRKTHCSIIKNLKVAMRTRDSIRSDQFDTVQCKSELVWNDCPESCPNGVGEPKFIANRRKQVDARCLIEGNATSDSDVALTDDWMGDNVQSSRQRIHLRTQMGIHNRFIQGLLPIVLPFGSSLKKS